jgi:hypothetical protein
MNQTLGKTGKSPDFPFKFKEIAPKAEVLEQPHLVKDRLIGDLLGF